MKAKVEVGIEFLHLLVLRWKKLVEENLLCMVHMEMEKVGLC